MDKFDRVVLGNVFPIWRRGLAEATSRILIACPYITSRKLPNRLPPGIPTLVYTSFNAEVFASGASSIRILRRLSQLEDVELFILQDLHAKIVLIPDQLATIGSQNLTVQGERNREASVVFRDHDVIAHLAAEFSKWEGDRQQITLRMIQDMEARLPRLRRAFREMRAALKEVDGFVKERATAESVAIQRRVDYATGLERQLSGLTREDEPWGLADYLVRQSAWWLRHPAGACRAEAHADRIETSVNGLRVRFGANSFLVGKAIHRCAEHMIRFLEARDWESNTTPEALAGRLQAIAGACVANFRDEEYEGEYGALDGNDLVFGSQSIDLKDFANAFLRRYPIQQLYAKPEDLG